MISTSSSIIALIFGTIFSPFLMVIVPPSSAQSHNDLYPSHCSARYSNVTEFPIARSNIGKSGKILIDDWKMRKYWGLDSRVKITNAPGTHTKSPAIEIFFPKGSINPGNKIAPRGGAGFYTEKGLKGQNSTRACLQYSVYIPADFEFVRGGKLPGLYGGIPPSGCVNDQIDQGFTLRYMWRQNGDGTLYAYHPEKKDKCGSLLGLRSWRFYAGNWHDITQEVILNDADGNNGRVITWINGTIMHSENEIILRKNNEIFIDGIMFSTFFGGNNKSWASPKDQKLYFADFKIFTR